MEKDAPVVGPDAPTANSTMVQDIATADPGRRPGASASPRRLDGGDVDILHRHHRREGTLCLTAASRKRIG